MSDLGLEGKVVVVTGSSRGWGAGIAALFADYGSRVVVNGTVAADVEAVAEGIRDRGGSAVAVTASVSADDGPDAIIGAALDNFGGVDVLVNNAGRTSANQLLDMSDEEWDAVIGVQLRGPFRCARAAARAMARDGRPGHIINVAGAAGIRGMYANANHAASKGGLLAATWSWALELRGKGIRVNAVRGAVDSATSGPLMATVRENLARTNPDVDTLSAADLGFLPPVEAAKLLVWLASKPAEGINGQYLAVDPGKITLWGRAAPLREIIFGPEWSVELFVTRLTPIVEEAGDMSRGVAEITPGLTHLATDLSDLFTPG